MAAYLASLVLTGNLANVAVCNICFTSGLLVIREQPAGESYDWLFEEFPTIGC